MAQEFRSEVSVQGTEFFTKDASGNGIKDQATKTGRVLVGYRYNITRWLAAEANYGYDRNTQAYFGSTLARVQSSIHQITGSAAVKLLGFALILLMLSPVVAVCSLIQPVMPVVPVQAQLCRRGARLFTGVALTTSSRNIYR